MAFASQYESIVLAPQNVEAGNHLLVFFITGNPGLCGYYEPYLTLLHTLCREKLKSGGTGALLATHIYSASLAGFETSKAPNAALTASQGKGPYDLTQQIDYIDAAVDDAYRDVVERSKAAQSTHQGKPNVRVVLIGHSVGSYIMLEVISRRQARGRKTAARIVEGGIIGGIGLTPTVVDIAKSSTGRKVESVASLSLFAPFVSALAKALFFFIPYAVLLGLVQHATGFPRDAADVTARFLVSPGGVLQALYLARYELAQITVDKWDNELWGVGSRPAHIKAKLFFLFAETDHWVANETRDQIIAARASTGRADEADKPEMEVDQTGLVHAFCIRHNTSVAEKTLGYLRKIVELNWQQD